MLMALIDTLVGLLVGPSLVPVIATVFGWADGKRCRIESEEEEENNNGPIAKCRGSTVNNFLFLPIANQFPENPNDIERQILFIEI